MPNWEDELCEVMSEQAERFWTREELECELGWAKSTLADRLWIVSFYKTKVERWEYRQRGRLGRFYRYRLSPDYRPISFK
jgi:hypothetical protein